MSDEQGIKDLLSLNTALIEENKKVKQLLAIKDGIIQRVIAWDVAVQVGKEEESFSALIADARKTFHGSENKYFHELRKIEAENEQLGATNSMLKSAIGIATGYIESELTVLLSDTESRDQKRIEALHNKLQDIKALSK